MSLTELVASTILLQNNQSVILQFTTDIHVQSPYQIQQCQTLYMFLSKLNLMSTYLQNQLKEISRASTNKFYQQASSNSIQVYFYQKFCYKRMDLMLFYPKLNLDRRVKFWDVHHLILLRSQKKEIFVFLLEMEGSIQNQR